MKHWKIALLAVLVIGCVWMLAPDIALAAPGGIIKAAARSTLGKIVFGLLAVIFAPVIIYYMIRSAIAKRRTRADLKRLAAQFPQYRWLDAKDRIQDTFAWVWSAWTQQKMSIAGEHTTAWYAQNQQLQLDEWHRNGYLNVSRLVKVESITPIFVQHNAENNGDGSRLVVDIRARVVDYLQDQMGNVIQGDKKEGDLDSVWTFVWNAGAWKLNKIEDGANEYGYLFAPNELPATQPERAANAVHH